MDDPVMSEPILVVHGIANHDPIRFSNTVALLQQQIGERYQLIEVFWGDLGGVSKGLRDALPVLFPKEESTRGESEDEVFFDLLQTERQKLMGAELTRGDDAVIEGIYRSAVLANGGNVPSELTRGDDDDLRQTLAEVIPSTRYLKALRDPEMQQAVGELLADYLQVQSNDSFGSVPGEIVTRGWAHDSKEAVARFIGKIDALIGKVSSNLAGSANQWARSALAESIAVTFGDVVAYHQRRRQVHERLFACIDENAPGYGTADRPITILAHSLGGLVSFDAALGSDIVTDGVRRLLHIKHWITFGSQPAFFHVLAPREGIAHYEPAKPVTLPGSIGRWTNLWHPMDIAAFSAAPVFRLADGSMPRDVRIDTPASEILDSNFWLHSAYWTSPQLLNSLD
jgi:hypothetical protein